MKTIIAPVDFSKASVNALSFAAELAKRASARLLVLTICEEDEQDANSKLQAVVADLKKSFDPELNCELLLASGKFMNILLTITEEQQPHLIVMGTKGASGLKKILIGSNTVNVVAQTKVPVFVIPEVAHFEDFYRKGKNRIVLATDLEALENDKALDVLKEIALLIFEPKVSVLNVRPKNTHLDYLTQMERSALLSVFKPEIESEGVTVFSYSVLGGINLYLTKKTDIGLVAMVARDSGHLIQKHYTREMASHTHLPLLVLQDTDTN